MNIDAEIKRCKKLAAKLDRENEKLGPLPGIRTSSQGDFKIYVEGGKRWKPYTINPQK